MSHLIVQLLHAAHQFGTIYAWGHGIPNIVLLEPVADRQDLDAVAEAVRKVAMPHYVYSEPYQNWGMTALIALARTEEERAVFKGFKKWDLNPPVAQLQSVSTLNREDGGADPPGRAKLHC